MVAMSASAKMIFVVFILLSPCRASSDDFLDALMAAWCFPYYKGRAYRCGRRDTRGKKRDKKDKSA